MRKCIVAVLEECWMVGGMAWTIAAAGAVLMVISGVAGVAVGGVSAAAGWWLIVVGGALFVGLVAIQRSRRDVA